MTVQVFGSGCSGFCANTALRECADDGMGRYQEEVIRSVHSNFYVDDFLMSLPDEKTAVDFVNAINRLLAEGGFRLHKWMSTSRKVIASINPTERAGSVKEISGDCDLPCDRALGMNWNVERDSHLLLTSMLHRKRLPKELQDDTCCQLLLPSLIRLVSCHLFF